MLVNEILSDKKINEKKKIFVQYEWTKGGGEDVNSYYKTFDWK